MYLHYKFINFLFIIYKVESHVGTVEIELCKNLADPFPLFFITQKGKGYHLDLFIVACLIIICSFLGLPFFVAATVLSITHVMSLKKESKCAAPGETPKFLGVRWYINIFGINFC